MVLWFLVHLPCQDLYCGMVILTSLLEANDKLVASYIVSVHMNLFEYTKVYKANYPALLFSYILEHKMHT